MQHVGKCVLRAIYLCCVYLWFRYYYTNGASYITASTKITYCQMCVCKRQPQSSKDALLFANAANTERKLQRRHFGKAGVGGCVSILRIGKEKLWFEIRHFSHYTSYQVIGAFTCFFSVRMKGVFLSQPPFSPNSILPFIFHLIFQPTGHIQLN